MQRYQFAPTYVEGKSILNVGCGFGYGTWILAQYGPTSVLGLDIDNATIKEAEARYKGDIVRFKLADAQQLPLADASYDIVVSLENIEHLPAPLKFVQEAQRVLKPEGLLIISAPNTSTHNNEGLPQAASSGIAHLEIDLPNMLSGQYTLSFWLGDSQRDYYHSEREISFEYQNPFPLINSPPPTSVGAIQVKARWRIES